MQTDKPQVAFFAFERETKGAVRYQEISPISGSPITNDAEGALVVNIYLRKARFNGGAMPKKFRITIDQIDP